MRTLFRKNGHSSVKTHNNTTLTCFIIHLAAPLIKELIDLTFHHSVCTCLCFAHVYDIRKRSGFLRKARVDKNSTYLIFVIFED